MNINIRITSSDEVANGFSFIQRRRWVGKFGVLDPVLTYGTHGSASRRVLTGGRKYRTKNSSFTCFESASKGIDYKFARYACVKHAFNERSSASGGLVSGTQLVSLTPF